MKKQFEVDEVQGTLTVPLADNVGVAIVEVRRIKNFCHFDHISSTLYLKGGNLDVDVSKHEASVILRLVADRLEQEEQAETDPSSLHVS